jgi:hypothetical protein
MLPAHLPDRFNYAPTQEQSWARLEAKSPAMAADLLRSRQQLSAAGRRTHAPVRWLAVILVGMLVVYWLR